MDRILNIEKVDTFRLDDAPKWDSCVCCSAKSNIKSLVISYNGGKHGHSITLCRECLNQLGTLIGAQE